MLTAMYGHQHMMNVPTMMKTVLSVLRLCDMLEYCTETVLVFEGRLHFDAQDT